MKSRAWLALPPGPHQPSALPCDDAEHRQDQRHIDCKRSPDEFVARRDRRQSGQIK